VQLRQTAGASPKNAIVEFEQSSKAQRAIVR
jgi:hypothetical protein